MPLALRGIDAITFAAFQALGLNLTVRPVLCESEMLEDIRWGRDLDSHEEDYQYDYSPLFDKISVKVGNDFHEVKYDTNDEDIIHIRRNVLKNSWEGLNQVRTSLGFHTSTSDTSQSTGYMVMTFPCIISSYA